jgi:Transposase DDE domain group 1
MRRPSSPGIRTDARTGKNGRHRLSGLLRQPGFGRLAGYEDVNDAERLCRDPAMRRVVGGRAIRGYAASANQMGRFETKWLSRPENLATLIDLPGQWIDKLRRRRSSKTIVPDMNSSESPTYGERSRNRPMYPRIAASAAAALRRAAGPDRAGQSSPPIGAVRSRHDQ